MRKIRIGITGQSGFIGSHLKSFLTTKQEKTELVPFSPVFFEREQDLNTFVSRCDVIVHLAAKNRESDDILYSTNLSLVRKLINALEKTREKPRVIFSSSIQENRDNAYGRSKREGRKLFEDWARRNNAGFTALIIPNVFGPFGKPFYNSVISTFSYQLTHDIQPQIEIDAELDLIYVSSLVEKIYRIIIDPHPEPIISIPAEKKMKVSELLEKLKNFHEQYGKNHIIPRLGDFFDIGLFNTYRSYFEPGHFPVTPVCSTDDRGFLIELVKELCGGQIFYSVTRPGITRGNHFHSRKIERFCVIQGEARLQLRRTGSDDIIEYRLDGSTPSFVDIPVFYSHNITNTGNTDLITIFWTNELYDHQDPDTWYENVNLDTR
jgi:UDP-2-acetamido-2,6-beta-L-arabino-hexul-4-ose reductase